ncbi:MAG: helix-turn-helix transcriptional regulator [Pseudomonadota bacterium]
MKAEDFRRWRKALGLNQKEAARALGLKKRVIQYYEKGKRDGREVEIPLSVSLACYAIANGIDKYDASEFKSDG